MNETDQQNDTGAMAVFSMERASIDMQIATAHQFPRTLSKVKQDMMSFATLDEETASSCFYTLPRGNRSIQGPSIRLAEIAVSCYGNLRAGSRIISVNTTGDNPHVVVQAVAHDLEKNVAISMEKRRNITAKKDRDSGERLPIAADDINLAANACSAIAFRDAVFKVVPLALVKPIMEAAKRVAIGEASSLAAKRAKVIDRLKQMGATEANILAAVAARKVDDIGLDKLETLLGLGTAIKDGELTLEQAFPAPAVLTQFVPPEADKEAAPKKRGRPKMTDEQKAAKVQKEPEESAGAIFEPTEPPQESANVADKLADALIAKGFTFDDLKAWNRDVGFLKMDMDSLSGFSELGSKDAERLYNSISGLIRGLQAAKK